MIPLTCFRPSCRCVLPETDSLNEQYHLSQQLKEEASTHALPAARPEHPPVSLTIWCIDYCSFTSSKIGAIVAIGTNMVDKVRMRALLLPQDPGP